MPSNRPDNMTQVVPYLLYSDLEAALEWLSRVFGFTERLRMDGPDGRPGHAEMEYGDGVILMGCPGPDYVNPAKLGHVTQVVCVYVDDVDAHCGHAREQGANIFEEPADQAYGERRYGAEDPEGHRWYFSRLLPEA